MRFLPSEEVAIEGGENAGRDVTYTNIVTDWETIGHWDGAAPVDLRDEDIGDDPLAVIVQQTHMGPVLTAAGRRRAPSEVGAGRSGRIGRSGLERFRGN